MEMEMEQDLIVFDAPPVQTVHHQVAVGVEQPQVVVQQHQIVPAISTKETLTQVDCTVEQVGKVRPQSKLKVTWRFQHCVGGHLQPHTVSIVWSVKTGKQEVLMDDTEVWFGRRAGGSIFSHQWTQFIPSPSGIGGTELKLHVLATRSSPKRRVAPDFRNHDLIINNQIFAYLPDADGTGPPPQPEDCGDNDERAPTSIVQILYPNGYDGTVTEKL